MWNLFPPLPPTVRGRESKFVLTFALPNNKQINKIIMEKEKFSAADIAALRVQAGQSENRQKSAALEFSRIPDAGKFMKPIVKDFVIDGKNVKSLGLLTESGDFVSESALTKSNLLKETVQIKSGNRKGRFMLRMQRLTDLPKFGKSQNEQIANLAGKKFTTEKCEIRTYKAEYLSSPTAFDAVTVKEVNDSTIDELMKKTEVTNGYVFNIFDDETAK